MLSRNLKMEWKGSFVIVEELLHASNFSEMREAVKSLKIRKKSVLMRLKEKRKRKTLTHTKQWSSKVMRGLSQSLALLNILKCCWVSSRLMWRRRKRITHIKRFLRESKLKIQNSRH